MMRAGLVLALVGACFARRPNPHEGKDWGSMDLNGVSAASGGSEIGLGFLYDDEEIWLNAGAKFREVPAWMEGMVLGLPAKLVKDELKYTWNCPKKADKGCMIYMFQYRCAGCDIETGDLPLTLLRQGIWEMFYCAPKFDVQTDPNYDHRHPFVAWRAYIPKKSKHTVTVTAPKTEYVVMGMQSLGLTVLCSNLEAHNCEDPQYLGQCEWDHTNGECINRTCKKKYTGPSGGPAKGTCAARCVDLDFQ